MFVDFGVGMDQIYNQLAKNTYMSGGNVNVPMVLTAAAVGERITTPPSTPRPCTEPSRTSRE